MRCERELDRSRGADGTSRRRSGRWVEEKGVVPAVSAFEDEVRRVAVMEGTIAPEVAVDADVTGWAASLPSGRLLRVHPDVLSLPEPAQRWLAGHEMRHVMAHGWSEPGRWLGLVGAMAGVGALGAGVWWSPLPPTWTLVAALGGLAGVSLLWLVGTSWWSRRLETEADQYRRRPRRPAGGPRRAEPVGTAHPGPVTRPCGCPAIRGGGTGFMCPKIGFPSASPASRPSSTRSLPGSMLPAGPGAGRRFWSWCVGCPAIEWPSGVGSGWSWRRLPC